MHYLCVCLFSVSRSIKSSHKACGAAPGVQAGVTVSWLRKTLTQLMGRSLLLQAAGPYWAEKIVMLLYQWLASKSLSWGKLCIFGKGDDFKLISHCSHSMWWPQVICGECLLFEMTILIDYCIRCLFLWEPLIWFSSVTLVVRSVPFLSVWENCVAGEKWLWNV